jgi:hypothetical protein
MLAVLVGGITALLCFMRRINDQVLGADFTWPWRGAHELLAGNNPYITIVANGPYPFDAPLYYPLPALLYSLPFAPFPHHRTAVAGERHSAGATEAERAIL